MLGAGIQLEKKNLNMDKMPTPRTERAGPKNKAIGWSKTIIMKQS